MKQTVPNGWKKGEPITVEKTVRHGKGLLLITRPISFPEVNIDKVVSTDEIYCIYHDSLKEHNEFIKWWFS